MRLSTSIRLGTAIVALQLAATSLTRPPAAEARDLASTDPTRIVRGQVEPHDEPAAGDEGTGRAASALPAPPEPGYGPSLSAEEYERADRFQKFASRADEIWLISTRRLGCLCGKETPTPDLEVLRYTGTGRWECDEDAWGEATFDEFLAADPLNTVVYVHGNRASWDGAFSRGWQVYDELTADFAAPRFRLVIWSWPSDRIRGQLRDVRYKAARTNSEALYLGWALSRISPETPLSLIGYSFGARVVTGALHVLADGSIAGHELPPALPVEPRGMRVVLIEAALHNYWLLPENYHGRASRFISQMLIIYNSCDPVLKRYRLIDKGNRPQALGYTGLWGLEGDLEGRVEQINACCEVGKTHEEEAYIESVYLMDRVQRFLWAFEPAADD